VRIGRGEKKKTKTKGEREKGGNCSGSGDLCSRLLKAGFLNMVQKKENRKEREEKVALTYIGEGYLGGGRFDKLGNVYSEKFPKRLAK